MLRFAKDFYALPIYPFSGYFPSLTVSKRETAELSMSAQQSLLETKIEKLTGEIKAELMAAYGAMLTGRDLYRTLGYPTPDAFRQAVSKKTVPVTIFPIENRRGKFALTKDVAFWLATQKIKNAINGEDLP